MGYDTALLAMFNHFVIRRLPRLGFTGCEIFIADGYLGMTSVMPGLSFTVPFRTLLFADWIFCQ